MKQLFSVLAIASLFVLSACGGKTPEQQFAADFCDCMGPLVDLQKEIMENPESAMSRMGEIEEMAGCAKDLEEKYKDQIGDELSEAYEDAIKKECPDVYTFMDENGGM